MGITPDSARHLINRTLRTAENRAAEEMRELENARLDLRPGRNLVQRAGRGQPGRDGFFLQISQRWARLNGLASPASAR